VAQPQTPLGEPTDPKLYLRGLLLRGGEKGRGGERPCRKFPATPLCGSVNCAVSESCRHAHARSSHNLETDVCERCRRFFCCRMDPPFTHSLTHSLTTTSSSSSSQKLLTASFHQPQHRPPADRQTQRNATQRPQSLSHLLTITPPSRRSATKTSRFLRATAVPAGTAEARISYANSVCLSVCPSRPGAETTE